MRGAVLCNGPSKSLYNPSDRIHYDHVIGCNVPWTAVDSTVVLDENIIRLWAKRPELITVPTYFSEHAWNEVKVLRQGEFFAKYKKGIIHPKYPYHSSGHNAVEILIREQYTEIDIYGCDSWFSTVGRSWTRTHIADGGVKDGDMTAIEGWRHRWREIMWSHPHVKVNFIQP